MIPSIRPIKFDAALSKNISLTSTKRSPVARVTTGRSNIRVVRESAIGDMMAVIPRIRNTLDILEPRTFPIDISVLPPSAASTDTTSSGTLVPTATIVRPIIASDIFHFLASATAPSTRILPQTVRRMRPSMIEPRAMRMSIRR